MAETIDSKVKPSCPTWYDAFVGNMKNLQQRERLPHAILLSLPRESNEVSFLWYLSMSLLCQESAEGRPCQQCSSCIHMLANSYPDFKLVGLEYNDATKKYNKNINIEQIRKVVHEVYITRSYDNLKIVVIYPADRMSIAGANSLLKTLEEPAENALLIIATNSSGKIPITIRSRCQQWNLQLPEAEEAMSWLEVQGLDRDQAVEYLNLSNFNPGHALKLYQNDYLQLVSEFKQKFSQYLKNQIDVVMLGQFLTGQKVDLARKMVATVVKAYCYQFCGHNESVVNKTSAKAMLELLSQVESQLMIEENNLDLQLQLIDVLISIKEIIAKSQKSIRSRE